jgi:tryptophan halogenase
MMPIPETLSTKIALFRDSGRFYRDGEEMFALTSWVQVMIGQRIVPGGYHPLVDAVNDGELVRLAESVRGVIASCVAAMPAHEAFIERYCKAPVAA